jgi:hypothetical protein
MMISPYPAKEKKLAELLESECSAEDICAKLGITYETLKKWVAMLVQREKKFFALPPDLSREAMVTVSPHKQISINYSLIEKLGLLIKPGDKLKIESEADGADGYTITLRKVS